jgi:FtsZ-binding cell division protein ZapB
MSLGRYEPDRSRRSPLAQILRLTAAVAVLAGIGLFAFQLGVEDERTRQGRLADEVAKLRESSQQLTQTNAALRQELQTAQTRLGELQTALGGAPKLSESALLLLPTLERKLAEGVDPKRLAEVVAAADKPRDCEAPETKRFLLRTARGADGPNTSVGFANGMITVSGQGAPAKNAEGRLEAWFDPAEPVTIRFTQVGGRSAEAAGKLPLHHTLAVGQAEHRFSVMAATRGFVQVTSERCKLP